MSYEFEFISGLALIFLPVPLLFTIFFYLDSRRVRKILKNIVDKNKTAPFGALMGEAMKQLRGKADGQLISKILKELTA